LTFKQSKQRAPLFYIVSVLLVVAPLVFWYLDIPFPANVLYLCLLYGIMGMAWNFLAGYAGQLSLGHATFFGVGAYTTIILTLQYSTSPWLGIPLGGLFAGVTGLALGIPFFRLRSHWFTLATVASAEVATLIFTVWSLVGGSAGLQLPLLPKELSWYYLQYAGPYVYVFLALGVLGVETVILRWLVNSKVGFYLMAIREDEDTAMAMGINPFKYKMLAMFVSAFFTGIGGGLYLVRFRFIDPYTAFDFVSVSTYIVMGSILGGIYTFIGPIVGSFIFNPITEYVRISVVSRFPRYFGLHVFVLGIILLAIGLAIPEGLMGWLENRGYGRKKREAEKEVVGIER